MPEDDRSDGDACRHGVVFFSVNGLVPFDASAVAAAIRDGKLTPMQAYMLAAMIDDTHPKGLKLKLHGQGSGRTMFEEAKAYDRIQKIAAFIEGQVAAGSTENQAILTAEVELDVSVATVRRDWRDYLAMKADEGR